MKHSVHLLALVSLSLTLAACGGSGGGGGGSSAAPATAAVIATRAPDFGSGAISLVDVAAPFAAQNNLPPNDTSDIFVRSGGDHYFVVQRFETNRILRFSVTDPSTPVYTYSTQDADDTDDSNPYDLVILSPTKAYLLRYGSDVLWIVNPSAATEAEFKIGEIDLSQYDPDGVPQMAAGLIKDGLLYVVLQRLDDPTFLTAVRNGYVAVIDTVTDLEIETGEDSEDLPGIELPVRNPASVTANPGNDDLLVLASGGLDSSFDPVFDGGIVRIDTSAFGTELMLDDGIVGNAPFGELRELAIVAVDRAYFIGSEGFFGNQNLYRFNPISNATPVAVSVAQNIKLSTVATDGSGRLFLGRSETVAPGITILDVSGAIEIVLEGLIDTVLTPINIDFTTAPWS